MQTRKTENIKYHLTERHIYGSARLGMDRTMVEMAPTLIQAYPLEPTIPATGESERYLGRKYYELSNHLGNVLTVITDEKRMVLNGSNYSHYESVVVSVTDYSPFGVSLTGRTFTTTEGYRYGFNGKEEDKEGMGGGKQTYDYGFRIYNPALAKFLSVDPLSKDYPWYTPYQFAGNKPIIAIDLDGLEEFIRIDYFNTNNQLYRTVILVVESGELENNVVVHLNSVFIDANGNANAVYDGTLFSVTNQAGTSSDAFGFLSGLIWQTTTLVPTTTDPRTPFTGSLNLVTQPSRDAITIGQFFDYNVPQPNGSQLGMSLAVTEQVPIVNSNIAFPDYSHNGILVFEPNPALVPMNEVWLPSGFNVTPPSTLRFLLEGGNPLVNGQQELNYNAPLDIQKYHAVGAQTATQSAASADGSTRVITNQPSMQQVGTGQATPGSGTQTVTIN